jgi:hypothetical protein
LVWWFLLDETTYQLLQHLFFKREREREKKRDFFNFYRRSGYFAFVRERYIYQKREKEKEKEKEVKSQLNSTKL